MKPIIKWVGGKSRFVKSILPKINELEFNNYYEPFLGSASIFLSVFEKGKKRKYYLRDYNQNLIDFYKWIKDTEAGRIYDLLSEKINHYEDLSEEDRSELYYIARQEFNNLQLKEKKLTKKEQETKSVLFFFINKTGFNGIYRVNSVGGFNVPKGRHSSHYYPDLKEIQEIKIALEAAEIEQGDWKIGLENVSKNDLVYLDPPYYPDETSKFIGYTDPAFGVEEHKELVRIVKKMVNQNGAIVFISNSASEEFRRLLKENFTMEQFYEEDIRTKRSINPLALDKERFIEKLYILKGEKNE